MRTNSMTVIRAALIALVLGTSSVWAAKPTATPQSPLSEAGQKLQTRYADQLEKLRTELTAKIPSNDQAKAETLNKFLANDALDAKLAKYVVLLEATPDGLAEFAQQGREQAALVERMLSDADLMKQMLVADGATKGKYGQAMGIYTAIQKTSKKAATGVLQRLALAISLEHAVPMKQANPTARTNDPETVDPVKRYLHYEKAYQDGELDPEFNRLSAWDLRMVVDGDEPNEALAWGREMLRNFRPDHILDTSPGWRYVRLVSTDVKYGSGNVKYDSPELQRFQNILINGGVCGRRAFIGRSILRSFGVPTVARPSRGHGALAHWTPEGWVVNLGGAWGCGWANGPNDRTSGRGSDLVFLATTQARANRAAFLKVKRAQWVGDVLEENRAFWSDVALKTQEAIVKESKAVTLKALGEDLGEANEPTVAEAVLASPVTPEDKKIAYGKNGVISIPAAAYSKPSGNTQDVIAMKSFGGGLQVFLPRFFPQGLTILRGGAWRGGADSCRSAWRMPSSGYGRYNNWGFRAAMNASGSKTPRAMKLDLGDGVTMEFVYIKPGTFTMGGENTEDSKWQGAEVPKHEVTISKGYYLGKYEVTQAQFQKIMGSNPSAASKDLNAPADTISEGDAVAFCNKLAETTGKQTRLPTEAEWEYACRAGTTTKYFFGNDPSKLGEYAWFDGNDGGTSHPVGQKKPNPWGLYDICGNVVERVSDKYSRSYYSTSPKIDPTGPSQGTKSRLEYEVTVPQSGKYTLTAQVVTTQHDQRLNVSANDATSEITMEMPFTIGDWQNSKPVTLALTKGENTLRFSRNKPPQYGMAVKGFTLTPVK